jgi:hypothetical protein
MIFRKDSFALGLVLGFLAPIVGFMIYKWRKFGVFTMNETYQYMSVEPGHKTLTVALTLSLLANAVLFTIYVNTNKDKTARGIFAATCMYAIAVLLIKFLG